MTAPSLFSRDRAVVKAHLVETLAGPLDALLAAAEAGELTVLQAERRAWTLLLEVGRALLTALFATMSWGATQRWWAAQQDPALRVPLRMDADYHPTLMTTMGAVTFPFFAVRTPTAVVVPARSLFPLYGTCRSSMLCLEWEAALASDHPFRRAATALGFFTHGAVTLDPATLRRHALRVGERIDPPWLWKTPAAIREQLRDHATRDRDTGRPLLYLSTDAHALRRFVDATWQAPWKMINGLRLWCIDKDTGETVHLGGQYTWGDCHEVVALLQDLQHAGQLPATGDYGAGVVAQWVVVTDGLPWIALQVLPLFPGALTPLDPFHVVGQIAAAANEVYAQTPARAKRLVKQARRTLGLQEPRPRARQRKGKKQRRRPRQKATGSNAAALLDVLRPVAASLRGEADDRWQTLLGYVMRNAERLNYGELRARGIGIGSGAMESLHKSASQLRLKRPGCRWTTEASHAILNLRMLALAGRWDEFWAQPDLAEQLAAPVGGAIA